MDDYEPCEEKVVGLIHGKAFFDKIEGQWDASQKECVDLGDSYYTKETAKAARLAVQGIILSIDNIMTKKWESSLALVRPPGHHADMKGCIEGFCVYNNVAIGARYAIENYKEVNKVLIFDWDIHHGNSTYKVLKEDKDVLFISLHRFDDGKFYPGKLGSMDNIGEGEGRGLKVHVPWSMHEKSELVGT